MRRLVWRALRGFAWTLAGLGAGVFLAGTLPVVWGWQSFTVMSGSMEPALEAGDVLVTRPITPAEAGVGDVVTFRDPAGSGRLITHRVRAMRDAGGVVRFQTRGDANNTSEQWAVPASGRIGRAVYRLRRLGYVLHAASSPPGRIVSVGLPALALTVLALLRIWRPPAAAEAVS